MRNLVKEYINSGKSWDELHNEYGIGVNEFDNLTCLNYDQIESPKTAPIVRQCRGIVLDSNTLDIVYYPFFRFYNSDEVLDEHSLFNFNSNKIYALQKLDGSLFGVFNHNGQWNICTRSQVGGMNNVSMGMYTFGDIFDQAIQMPREQFFDQLNPNYNYIFELCSPLNIIVQPFEQAELYLIGVRDRNEQFKELNPLDVVSQLPSVVKCPKMYNIIDDNGNFIGIADLKMMANNLEHPTDEGFVLVDFGSYNDQYGYYPRMKVKNSSYVALHHLRGSIQDQVMNYGRLLEIVWKNEQDEVLAVFPHFKNFIDDVNTKYINFMNQLNAELSRLDKFFNIDIADRADGAIKKEFATAVKDSSFKNFLFNMFNKNQSFRDHIDYQAATHPKYFKKFWEEFVSKF